MTMSSMGNHWERNMSDAMNFAETAGQHVEFLPARVVMSVYVCGGGVLGSGSGNQANGHGGNGGAGGGGGGDNTLAGLFFGGDSSGTGGVGGAGGRGQGGLGDPML